MTTAAIRFNGVCKRFGTTRALDNVSFEVPKGACVGLAGVNGAGKTTLIKCLLDFQQCDTGAIEIDGIPVDQPAARRTLSYLPERFIAPHYLNGSEFIDVMLALSKATADPARTGGIARALDLDPAAFERPARLLSKGTMQKLGLAACLAANQDTYVLDEPMSGLDPRARARTKELLASLRAEGRTVFFTSHALADIEEICSHMIVLHAGTVRYAGAPDELRSRLGANSLEHAFLTCIAGHD